MAPADIVGCLPVMVVHTDRKSLDSHETCDFGSSWGWGQSSMGPVGIAACRAVVSAHTDTKRPESVLD